MKNPSDMISNETVIQIVGSIAEAPNYGTDVTMLKVKKCIVVKKGTKFGYPTIDIRMEDASGKKHLVMATGGLMQMIAAAVKGAAEATSTPKSGKVH